MTYTQALHDRIVEFAKAEADRLGAGWCRVQFIRALPKHFGDRVGVLFALRIAELMPKDPETYDRVMFALCHRDLPACRHQGRDGQPSSCPWEYSAENFKNIDAEPFYPQTGFKSLLARMREGGKQ